MTSRERLMVAFRCGTPDRVPVSPQGFGKVPRDSPLGQELVRKTDFILYAGGGVNPFIGNSFHIETQMQGDTTVTIYHSPKGTFQRVTKRTHATSACVDFPCKNADDVERLLSVPYVPPTEEQIRQAAQRFIAEKDWLGDEGVVLYGIGDAICFPAEWLAPMDFCLLWADAPDLMEEMVRIANERLLPFVDALCRYGVDAFRIVGGEYASEQLGPAAYERLVVAPDKALVATMHEHGALAYFHNHGPIMRYLPLIQQIGVDALDPLEAPPWGDCDIAAAKRLLKGQICLVGNLDDMEVMDKLPPQEVVWRGLTLVEQAGLDGFVLSGTASGIYGERAARNFLALADAVRQLF